MWKQSVWTSVIAASLASRYLKNGGLLTLPGAQPAMSGTPGKEGLGCVRVCPRVLCQIKVTQPIGSGESAYRHKIKYYYHRVNKFNTV